MSNITSIIIVAVLGVVGNISYFEYKTKKEKSKDLLRLKLTKLLLPLYVILHVQEVSLDAWLSQGDGDPAESHSDLPKRIITPIEDIIKENIYLADDQLHEACVSFLQWAYSSDTNERFQNIMEGKFDPAVEDGEFKKFRDMVINKYNNARHQYSEK